jgi:hypothetical protein
VAPDEPATVSALTKLGSGRGLDIKMATRPIAPINNTAAEAPKKIQNEFELRALR